MIPVLIGCAGTPIEPSASQSPAEPCAGTSTSHPVPESLGDTLGSEAWIAPPWPEPHLSFGASLATGDIDGDGREEVLVGTADREVTPF
jgi:hypothetical protein